MGRNIIPQVPLFACLTKFDGSTFQEMMNGDRRQYVITRLPQYLIIHIKRFSKNTQQYVEKNPTIVNFPVRNLDLAAYTELSEADKEKNVQTKFHLMSSTQHDASLTPAPTARTCTSRPTTSGTTSRTCTSTASTRSSSPCPNRTSRSTTRRHHRTLCGSHRRSQPTASRRGLIRVHVFEGIVSSCP